MLYGLIVLLPLGAAAVAGLFGRWVGDRGAQWVTCGAVSVSAILSATGFDSTMSTIGRSVCL